MTRGLTVTLLAACAVCAVCRVVHADPETSRVLGSIDIAAGQHTGDLSTVNGSIHIGENAVVGHATTVNGAIKVGRHATVAELSLVNGPVNVGEGAHVDGGVHAVNGPLTVDNGADLRGGLLNVNGPIRVGAAHLGGDIVTVGGDIELGPNARVDGGIHIEKDTSWFHLWFWHEDIPRVVIGPGSVVGGTLKFEREVKLYVSDRATIGHIEGATAVRFSGERPPP
jgi:carbonic anhydrase/acetyltransferase-like protein (isoleucine patch superfamily)